MEKFNIAYSRQLKNRLTCTGIACVIGLCLPQLTSTVQAQESVVQKEINRRINNARKGYALLQSGDKAYKKRDYKTAVNDYAQAFALLPRGSRNQKLRSQAAERYATAATERSRQLAKKGDYKAAKALLDKVLAPNVAPAHLAAIKLRSQIDDPIRYNPALTPEHVTNVQRVGWTLRRAEGFYELGDYDKALETYREVLRIDPFNRAARRGMEKVDAARSDYYRAARDQTRSSLLSKTDQAWETPVNDTFNPNDGSPLLGETPLGGIAPQISLADKLAGITVENIHLDNVTLEEAIDFLRVQSREGDAPSITGEKTGINFIINLGDPQSETAKAILSAEVNITAHNLPIATLLGYITDQTHTKWKNDGASIIITPAGSSDSTIITKTFHVPPNFLDSAAEQKTEDESNIFDSPSKNTAGHIPKKVDIVDFLKANGVTFPEGSGASYNGGSNTLIIRNTADNIDIVEQLVDAISKEEPVQVVIRTTIMRVSEKRLKALNFDWLISPAYMGNHLTLGGGTVGNGTPLTEMPLNPFSGLGRPITSGTRSGTTGLSTDSIDNFINHGSLGFGESEVRAPGILTITGVYSGIQIQMMMRGLDQKKGTDIMAKPAIITKSGQRAKLEVIREFIYPTAYDPPELPNNTGQNPNGGLGGGGGGGGSSPVTPAHPTDFETRNEGITIEVEPTVGPNKKFVELSIYPQLVEFMGFVNYGTPIIDNRPDLLGNMVSSTLTQNGILMPVFKTTQLKNQTVSIQDGATIVLGGLMESRIEKIEDKVPLLGDLPIAGRLFRSEAQRTIKQAIIITIQVELIDPSGVPWRNR